MVSSAVALLVEDDVPVRELTARMLALEGYEVMEAANGLQALNAIERGAPISILVTDLIMPVMDGFHLLETLRSTRPLPSVAMTATLSLSEGQEKRLGGAPLLYKPFTIESFSAAIRAAQVERQDFTYEIDAAIGVVSIRPAAVAKLEEKIAIVNRIWAEPEYRRGFSMLVDRRGYNEIPSGKDVRAFIRYVGEHEARIDLPSRWAVVADRPSACRFYQSIEGLAAASGVNLRAFQDYELAIQWGTRRR